MISLTGPRHTGMFCLCSLPSSATAEVFFSNCFTDRQICSLEDYIKTSVMLQYNPN